MDRKVRKERLISTPEGVERQQALIPAALSVMETYKLNNKELATEIGVSKDVIGSILNSDVSGEPQDSKPAVLAAERWIWDKFWMSSMNITESKVDSNDIATGQERAIAAARQRLNELEPRIRETELTHPPDRHGRLLSDLSILTTIAAWAPFDCPGASRLKSHAALTSNMLMGWWIEIHGECAIKSVVSSQLRVFLREDLALLRASLENTPASHSDDAWVLQGIGQASSAFSRGYLLLRDAGKALVEHDSVLKSAENDPVVEHAHILHAMSFAEGALRLKNQLRLPPERSVEVIADNIHAVGMRPDVLESFTYWCHKMRPNYLLKRLFSYWSSRGKVIPKLLLVTAALLPLLIATAAHAGGGETGGVKDRNPLPTHSVGSVVEARNSSAQFAR